MSAWRHDDLWSDRRRGSSPLLDAALEAIGRAAIVVDASGNILQTNTLARALLAEGDEAIREVLRSIVGADAQEHPGWSTTPVVTAENRRAHLVVARPTPGGVAARVAKAARAWKLTERQHQVLTKVASGTSNKAIAESLALSVRTVEVHLTALFIKAQVASRAELLVKLSAIE